MKKDIFYYKDLDKRNTLFIPLSFDRMFKALFEVCNIALKKMIIDVLLLDLDPYDTKAKLKHTSIPVSTHNEYLKTLDMFAVLNDHIYVSLEVNSERYVYVKYRNYAYSAYIFSTSPRRGQGISSFEKNIVYQMNINVHKSDKKQMKCYLPKESETNEILLENHVIITGSVEHLRELYYNGSRLTKGQLWYVFLSSTSYTEAYEILGLLVTDEERDEIMEKIEQLNNSEVIIEPWRMVEFERAAFNDAQEISRREGEAQGSKATSLSIAKRLLSMKMSIDDVVKATGLSKKTVSKLQTN